MKTRTWNIPLVTFLSGGNTVILKNAEEVKEFIDQMALLGIDASVLLRGNTNLDFGLLVEFDNGKGTTSWNHAYKTIGEAIQASTEWYGLSPFNWEDIKVLSFAAIQDEYWKQKILQEAESIECEVNPKRTEEIITTFLNDDSVWYTVEGSIRYYLEEEK